MALRKCGDVPDGRPVAVDPVGDDLRDPAREIAHHGDDAGGHRLEQGHRQAFRPRRHHEHVVLRVERQDLRHGLPTHPADPGAIPPPRPERRLVGPGPHQRPGDVGALLAEPPVDGRQVEDALALVHAPHVAEPQRARRWLADRAGNRDAVRQIHDAVPPMGKALAQPAMDAIACR